MTPTSGSPPNSVPLPFASTILKEDAFFGSVLHPSIVVCKNPNQWVLGYLYIRHAVAGVIYKLFRTFFNVKNKYKFTQFTIVFIITDDCLTVIDGLWEFEPRQYLFPKRNDETCPIKLPYPMQSWVPLAIFHDPLLGLQPTELWVQLIYCM